MAGAGDIRAGGAYVEVTCEGSKLEAGLKDAESATQQFQRKLDGWSVAVGAAVTAAFVGATKALNSFFGSMLSKGDQLDKMSQRIGVSVEGIQKLSQMAKLSGSSMETFEGAITKLQKSLEGAAQGGAAQQQAFQRLGLSITDLKAMSPEDQFLAVSKAMGGLTDQSEKTALAMELFGRSGTQLMPFFNQGSEGISEMETRIREMGGVMTKAQTDAVAGLVDTLTILKGGISGTAASIMADLAPWLNKALKLFEEAYVAVRKFLSTHPGIKALIGTVGGAAVAFGTAATAMTAWGLAAGKLSAAIKLVSGALTAFKASNPWIIALTAAGAAVGGLIGYLHRGQDAIAEFTHEAESQTQTHREQADANNALMKRLEELNAKQNKSAEEMAEAEAICQRLNSAYGDLGLTVDKTTGSINGLTEAQKKMAEAQKNMKIADTKAEITEAQKNYDAAEKRAAELRQKLGGRLTYGQDAEKMYLNSSARDSDKEVFDELKQIYAEREAASGVLQSRQQYLNELENGVDLESTSAPTEPAAPVDTADSERNRLESVRDQASRIGVSDYDLALRDAAEALAKTTTDAEKVKEADIAGGMSAEDAEARFQETMDAAQAIYDEAVQEAADKAAAAEKALADQREREAKEAADELERVQKERQRVEEEERRKIADQQKREAEYQKERNKILAQDINEGIKESATVKGTFSAFESSTDNGYQQKILKANEQVQKFTKKMYEELVQLNEKYAAGYTA